MADTYKVKEVADKLDCTPLTIYRMIREGNIPAIRIGRNFRIPREAMDKWLKEEIIRPKKAYKYTLPRRKTNFSSYKIGVKGNLTRKELYSER